jgi:hypothetical protein
MSEFQKYATLRIAFQCYKRQQPGFTVASPCALLTRDFPFPLLPAVLKLTLTTLPSLAKSNPEEEEKKKKQMD